MSLTKLLTVASLLLTGFSVNAGHFSDLHRQHYARLQSTFDTAGPAAKPESKFRYLTKKTAKYRVKSLPGVPFDVGEMYSGLMPIDEKDPSRALFFVFQPTVAAKPVDEVTIWLNGGPGCSSLGGFFQENGLFSWQPGTLAPVINQYSWVNLTNMLWVEQPVGTGFSIGKVTATNQVETAEDFVKFYKNFQKTFAIKNYDTYVTGESYAGRYVPYISAQMLDQKDPVYYNLKGAIAYDPCIGEFDYTQSQVQITPFVEANSQLFNFGEGVMHYLKSHHKSCGYEALIDKYFKFPPPGHQPPAYFNYSSEQACDLFDITYSQALKVNPCFNIYDITQNCPLLSDPLSFPTGLFVYSQPTYFNRADVKKAMHAPEYVDWSICSKKAVFVGGKRIDHGERYNGGPEGEGDESPDPIQHVLPQVIEATNRVLVGNGDYDMIILTQGTLMSIQNMSWNGKLGFQKKPSTPFHVKLPDLQYKDVYKNNGLGVFVNLSQGIQGLYHYERGLMWVETYQSGHMEPEFQPRATYRHLQWLLRRIEHF